MFVVGTTSLSASPHLFNSAEHFLDTFKLRVLFTIHSQVEFFVLAINDTGSVAFEVTFVKDSVW